MNAAHHFNTELRHSFTATKKAVAFVLSDECDLLAVGVLAEALECANELSASRDSQARPCQYEMQYVSASGGIIKCSRSLPVCTDALSAVRERWFNRVFVAAGPKAKQACEHVTQGAWLQRMRRQGAEIRFLAGSASSHVSSAGGHDGSGVAAPALHTTTKERMASALQIAFDMIRGDLGDSLAQEAVRRAAGDQAGLLPIDTGTSPADRVRVAARWLRDNCHRVVTVADAADACALSDRSLLRHFQHYLGVSPSEYLQRVRLELAREMLVATSLPADKIARRVGLTSGDRLGKLFRRSTGMSPTEYRARMAMETPREEIALPVIPPACSPSIQSSIQPALSASIQPDMPSGIPPAQGSAASRVASAVC